MARAVSIVVAMVGVCLGLPASGGWFAGVDLGYAHVTFRPYYLDVLPTEIPNQYTDRAGGPQLGVVLGHEWRITPGIALGAQARVACDGATWRLDITVEEHAHLEYDIRATAALSVVPAVRLGPELWLTGEAGYGFCRVRERKTSTDYSAYRFVDWVGCLVAGAGLRYELDRTVDLTVAYRFRRADSFTYWSYLGDGRHWETITDRPYQHSLAVGIRLRFGR